MTNRTRLTKDDITELRNQGMTVKAIADMIGTSVENLYLVSSSGVDIVKLRCLICGKEFWGKENRIDCGSRECHKRGAHLIMMKRERNAVYGKIREFTPTTDMMISIDLMRGDSLETIAKEYDRDLDDLKRHLRESLTEEKIKHYQQKVMKFRNRTLYDVRF